MAITIPPVTPPSSGASASPVNYYQLFLDGQRDFRPATPPIIPGGETSNKTVDLFQLALDGTLDDNLDNIPESNFIRSLEERSRALSEANDNSVGNVTPISNNRSIANLFNELALRLNANPAANILDLSNDNIPSITETDTQLSVENVVAAQEIEEVPANNFQLINNNNNFNVYSYTINALQGGLNEADPLRDMENRTEFEV